MARRLVVALIYSYILTLIFYHLASLPGLHGDEAWVGLYAFNLRKYGLYTLHEMNTYTGPVYGLLLAKVFGFLEPSIFSLRLPGAIFNALAAGIMAYHFAKESFASALAWLYLLGTSAMFLFKSRLAWEVYALQNLLLAVVFVLSRRMIEDKDFSFLNVFLFLLVNYIGVLNHFIFISVPLSLTLALSAYLALCRDWSQVGFFQLTAANLLQAALVYGLKPRISDKLWQSHWLLFYILFSALPFLGAVVYRTLAERLKGPCRKLFEQGWITGGRARRFFKWALATGLAFFAVFHLVPVIDIWSGVVILKRMVSWSPPIALSLLLYAWAAALLGVFFSYAFASLDPGRFARLSSYERFLVFWPLVYMAIFIIVRNTSAIRYYAIPIFLFQVSLAFILPRLAQARFARAVASCLCVAALLHVCFWRELAWPKERRPFQFKIGWRNENSWDFLSKAPLYEIMEREKLCQVIETDSMIELPLLFYLKTHSIPCDYRKALAARLCWECGKPPFITWTVFMWAPSATGNWKAM